ncbi:MAG: hypothetical protein ACP5H8_02705 [Candidatus Micrarchaeia archaeon]
MEYPEDAIAVAKTGKREVRVLMGEGRYIMYRYREVGGKDLQKYSILLETSTGEIEHIMIVPTKEREIVVKHTSERPFTRGIWDEKHDKVVKFP